MQDYTYSSGDNVLVWREKIVNNRIGEFIGPLIFLHDDERSWIVLIYQDGAIKRYSASNIWPFLEQPSMLDDSIIEREIENRHDKTYQEPDELEFDGDSVQLNIDQQSHEEQLSLMTATM